jgi:hypothetical protein
MRFILADAGRDWYEWQAFGECCEAAALNVEQAEAARLAACFLSFAEIADALSALRGTRIGIRRTKDRVLSAEGRLKRCLPHLVRLQRQDARQLLAAMRNVRSSNPNIAIYREYLGVHDRDPVRFASRLEGECAEDLTEEPLRFLRDLPTLLCRVDESRRD